MNKIEHEDVRSYAQKYLNMGEWIMDNSIVFMSNSSYFVRNNGNNNDHWFSIPYTFYTWHHMLLMHRLITEPYSFFPPSITILCMYKNLSGSF